YLWARTRKNAIRRFFAGLKRPRKLMAALVRVALLGFLLVGVPGSMSKDLTAEQSAALMSSYLAVVLVLSIIGGLTERGIAFSPSDVDFLFAGPFSRRSLVLHHVAGLYPATILAAVL